MDWMYKGNDKGVNPDDYLLGKHIDSAVLESQREEEAKQRQSASGGVTVDINNKIREDPLFAIKQKEALKRKALLENPIRLKQLQQMLQAQVGTKTQKKKKKKKEKRRKEKKRKRSHHESSDSSDESDDSDDDLDAKLMAKLKSRSLQGREDEVREFLKRPGYGLIGGKPRDKEVSRVAEEEEEMDRRGSKKHSDRRRRDDDDDELDRRRRDRDGETRSRSFQGRYKDSHHSRRSQSRSPPREKRKKARKMDEEELESRRQEMMDNAKWRDEQRKTRVDKYKAADAKESEMEERKKSKRADFFNPLKLTSNSSVEDRIKRNIHNIQRTKADLEKNFARR